MHSTRHHDESGQGMLELALCVPLFVLLVLGTAEIANVAWWSVQVNNAAHAGAQFGSLSHANAANPTNIETAAKNDVPTSLSSTMTFPTAPTQSCTCIDSTGNATSMACSSINTTTCASPDVIQDTLTVSVQAVVRPIVHYPGLPATYTLNATATTPVVNQ